MVVGFIAGVVIMRRYFPCGMFFQRVQQVPFVVSGYPDSDLIDMVEDLPRLTTRLFPRNIGCMDSRSTFIAYFVIRLEVNTSLVDRRLAKS